MKEVEFGEYHFPFMHQIIPEQKCERYFIHHNTATKEEAEHRRLMSLMSFSGQGYSDFQAGTWCVLQSNNGRGDSAVLMSDTIMERRTNERFCLRVNGHVLIGGLGIGLVLTRVVPNPRVQSVTVLELEPEIISMVEPHIRAYLNNHSSKLTIVQADVHTWQPDKKYDCIYMDIWADICGDNWEQMKELGKRYRKWLNRTNPASFFDCWEKEHTRSLK